MKVKMIIFDLDGVLADSRELHYESLNLALAEINTKYIIERDEHLSTFDGLNTTKKLQMLTELKGLPKELHNLVWKRKQDKTMDLIDRWGVDSQKRELFRILKADGYSIGVCSNSVRDTTRLALIRMGLMDYVDFYYSNQDVQRPKPAGEIYMKCMLNAGIDASETLIIEDSHIGRTAALNSGAHLLGVRNPSEVTYQKIRSRIEQIEQTQIKPKWQGGKMKVLIPMAGAGSRFQAAGYTFPKPLIDVNGKPMIQVVVNNINVEAEYIFIVQKEHYEKYHLAQLLNLIAPGCKIVQVDGLTEGAACTTLLAKEHINVDEPLLIANSDQFVEWDSNKFMYSVSTDNIDGGIVTFTATHPKWSFAKLDAQGFVERVAEKEPISDIATVGIYYWRRGSDYVKYAEQMIQKNIRVNNEFYVCPVFNEAIQDNKKFKVYPIEKMWGIGTPEDLNYFLTNYKENE